jgi:Tol biopolymer transport system component/DNA-binding winged helix-turn-helix (wHTH) protein
MAQDSNEIYELGPFRINAGERVLRRDGRIIPLTPKCFDTLLVLAQHSDSVVEKQRLMREVWPDSFVEESNLAQNIFVLRKTLGETAEGAKYIQTIPKRGYRLVVPAPETAPAVILPATASLPASPLCGTDLLAGRGWRRVARKRRISLSMAAAIAIGLALIAARWFWPSGTGILSDIRFTPLIVANSLAYAIISPDGKHIAYVATDTEGQSLWTRPAASVGAGIRLAGPLPGHFWGVSYTPTGEYLYYVFENQLHPVGGALFRIAAQGGEGQQLMVGISGAPSFSPDGGRLVFKRYGLNERGYLLMATALGTEPKIIATSGASYAFCNYQWAADGKSIYYAEGTRNSGGIAWSIFDLPATEGPAKLAMAPLAKHLRSVNWLNRSEILALIADDDSGISQIWHLRAGRPARRLTNGITDYAVISIAGDARTILANSAETQDSIWTASAPGMGRRESVRISLPAGSYNDPVWTPDGRIVYAGQSNLWLATADGRQRKQLVPEKVIATEPAVSADGRSVVFALRRQGSLNLWRSDMDGSGFRQVTTGRFDWHPALSPDGKWVAYASDVQGHWTLWKAPFDGTGPRVKLVDSCRATPVISPDGKLLAYTGEIGGIQVRSFGDGSLMREMTAAADASDLQWSRDGKALIFSSQADRSQQFWSQPLGGGPPVRIGDPLPGDVLHVGWSRDASRIVYLRRELKADAALISNFR